MEDVEGGTRSVILMMKMEIQNQDTSAKIVGRATMPKCPSWGEEIEELNAFSEIASTYMLNSSGQGESYGLDHCEGYTEFDCPECSEKLFSNEEEAIKFLKGEK